MGNFSIIPEEKWAGKGETMKQVLITLSTPETQDECNELTCEECSIMHDTQYGSGLPRCLYREKSMYFLQMQAGMA